MIEFVLVERDQVASHFRSANLNGIDDFHKFLLIGTFRTLCPLPGNNGGRTGLDVLEVTGGKDEGKPLMVGVI